MATRHSRKRERNSDNFCLLTLVKQPEYKRKDRIRALADCGFPIRMKASSDEVYRKVEKAAGIFEFGVSLEKERQRSQNQRRNRRRKFQ